MGFSLITDVIENEKAKAKAKSELLNFTIIYPGSKNDSSGGLISGLLKNKPKFSLDATYDRFINTDQFFSTLNRYSVMFTQKSFGTSQAWSEQIFKGGSYLNISLTTRILQEGDIDVVDKARELVKLCSVSESNDPLSTQFNKMAGVFPKDSKKQKPPNTATNIQIAGQQSNENKNGDKPAVITVGVMKAVGGELGNLLEDAIVNSPPRVTLYISNFFRLNGFYVKSVDFDFSHEQTDKGPIYADIEISLIHSQILSSDVIKNAFGYIKKG
jgi:hypothetical protein